MRRDLSEERARAAAQAVREAGAWKGELRDRITGLSWGRMADGRRGREFLGSVGGPRGARD